jgi:adenylate cyclase class IV
MELEVVLQPDQDESEGVAIALDLMRALGIRDEDLVDQAYFDLLKSARDLPIPPARGPGRITW